MEHNQDLYHVLVKEPEGSIMLCTQERAGLELLRLHLTNHGLKVKIIHVEEDLGQILEGLMRDFSDCPEGYVYSEGGQ